MLQTIELNPWLRKRIIIFIILLLIPLIILEIWAANRLSNYGSKISKIEESKAQLVLENEILENEIAQKSSLKEIENQAQNLGFENKQTVVYLKPQDLALNH